MSARWEWRTFGDAGEVLVGAPERVEDSSETYLLSPLSEASVKVRDALMDVKELQAVNDDGLEQWKPVLKGEFPLSAEDARTVLSALGMKDVEPARGEYTLEQLVSELVEANGGRAVAVTKHREHHTVGGCMAERSQISVEGQSRPTIAIESEDPGAVVAALAELGLSGRRNVNVPRGLKSMLGLGRNRFAVIDVGTNSVKFHIGEREEDGGWTTVEDRAEVTRLGEGLDEGGELQQEPMRRTAEAIGAMADEAKQQDVEEIAAVGTAGLRIASNSSAFVELVRERTGIEVEVIAAEEEARLAFLAVQASLGLGEGSLAVFDTGGGSSQFTFGEGGHIEEQFSVNVGAARFTERFGLDRKVDEETLRSALDAIASELSQLDDRAAPDTLVGMGGAVTNLAAVEHGLETYDPEVIQGTVLDRDEIDRQIELFRTRDAAKRSEVPGLQPKRAEVILAGACIVRTVLDKLGRDELTVSDRGLRHGLLVERFGK